MLREIEKLDCLSLSLRFGVYYHEVLPREVLLVKRELIYINRGMDGFCLDLEMDPIFILSILSYNFHPILCNEYLQD